MCHFSDEESKNLLRNAITNQEDSNNVGINLDLTVNVAGADCDCCEDSTGDTDEEDTPGAEGSGSLSVDNNGQTTVNLQGAAA